MEKIMEKRLELLKLQAETKEINNKIRILKDQLENLNTKHYKLVSEIDELEEEFIKKFLETA